MQIRLADLDSDAFAIMTGARDFISRIDFAEWIPETEFDLAGAIGRILTLDGVEVALAIEKEAVVGGLGIIYSPYLWNPDITAAEELFFWTAREAPGTAALQLLRFVRRRIVENGAKIVAFKALTTSPASLEKAYRAMGLRHIETTYMGAA